jgi:hypothetical protein
MKFSLSGSSNLSYPEDEFSLTLGGLPREIACHGRVLALRFL